MMHSSPRKPAFDIEIRNWLQVLIQNFNYKVNFCKIIDLLDVSLSSFQISNSKDVRWQKKHPFVKKSKHSSTGLCKNSPDSSNIPDFGQTCQTVSNLAQKKFKPNPSFWIRVIFCERWKLDKFFSVNQGFCELNFCFKILCSKIGFVLQDVVFFCCSIVAHWIRLGVPLAGVPLDFQVKSFFLFNLLATLIECPGSQSNLDA